MRLKPGLDEPVMPRTYLRVGLVRLSSFAGRVAVALFGLGSRVVSAACRWRPNSFSHRCEKMVAGSSMTLGEGMSAHFAFGLQARKFEPVDAPPLSVR
jgi:hypothetical protein